MDVFFNFSEVFLIDDNENYQLKFYGFRIRNLIDNEEVLLKII